MAVSELHANKYRVVTVARFILSASSECFENKSKIQPNNYIHGFHDLNLADCNIFIHGAYVVYSHLIQIKKYINSNLCLIQQTPVYFNNVFHKTVSSTITAENHITLKVFLVKRITANFWITLKTCRKTPK